MPYKDPEKARIRSKKYCKVHKKEKAAYDKAYHKVHKDKKNAFNKIYYETHREALLTEAVVYYEAHKKERQSYNRAYYEANRKKILMRKKEYYESNKEDFFARNATHKALMLGATIGNLAEIREIYRHAKEDLKVRCYLCGKLIPMGHRHVDHITPLSKGGAHRPSNLAVACEKCNLSKHAKLPEYVGILL